MNLKKKIYGKKKLGISTRKTHIKYGKKTYLGKKKTLGTKFEPEQTYNVEREQPSNGEQSSHLNNPRSWATLHVLGVFGEGREKGQGEEQGENRCCCG